MRAGGAGIPGFYTKTGVGTQVAEGKDHEEFADPDGIMSTYILERGIFADLSIVKAWKADETGNLIFGEFSERQRLNLWQVPLGIEYRQASKRLAWQLELGAVLNVLQAGAPEWTGRVYSSQQALATEISSKREAGTDRKVQWGLEGGMGLHYRLLPRLTLRGDLLYQLNPNFNQQSLQVGLGYLF